MRYGGVRVIHCDMPNLSERDKRFIRQYVETSRRRTIR
jgi:hypothetical protein